MPADEGVNGLREPRRRMEGRRGRGKSGCAIRAGNSARGDASTARRNCSTNMALLSGQRPAGEGLSGDRRITGQAVPLPKAITFSLTRDRILGEDQDANRDLSPAPA